MPRPKRADEKDASFHALKRSNGRWTLFRKDADCEVFESILSEGLPLFLCRILACQLMPPSLAPGAATQ
ncbi:hypothetical protein [Novipirellula galeiformis]|uniref:hypothetical protein n=1 Tax=Novipirellula galeiformis TaxID=2528004 RepID=UPI0011B59C97|nr:hypothetical protein [Novipirellula galeiformis]